MNLLKSLTKRGSVAEQEPPVSVISRNGDSACVGKIIFEMNLHVPCRISGITRNGTRWEGDATTVGLNSFGAHLLVPLGVELEGDVSLFFRIPIALRSLFVRKTFRIRGGMRPSGGAGPGLAPLGRKIVYVAFADPLDFKVRDAASEA